MKHLLILAAIAVMMLFSGCTLQPDNAAKLDNISSNETGLDLSAVDGNNKLAFELYSKLAKEDKNVFFSPWSMSSALAMTYEGARGSTADEISKAMHFNPDDSARRASFEAVYDSINSGSKFYNLSTANALWLQKDYPVLQSYKSTVDSFYHGSATNVDFIQQPEPSRMLINKWVADNTNQKIKDLLPQGAINANTRLVITNAVYFKGDWVKQFNKNDTKKEKFTTSAGDKVDVNMMLRTGKDAVFNYAEDDVVQVLEMPYSGDKLSMIVILPKQNLASGVLSLKKLDDWKAKLSEERVDVYFPKLKMETKYSMNEYLISLGMKAAFEPGKADFSGIDGGKELFISAVIHQAYVDVNEEGTEAAAATGVVVGVTSVINEKPIPVFRADHPFIFIIQDKKSGNILFMGRVANPAE